MRWQDIECKHIRDISSAPMPHTAEWVLMLPLQNRKEHSFLAPEADTRSNHSIKTPDFPDSTPRSSHPFPKNLPATPKAQNTFKLYDHRYTITKGWRYHIENSCK